MRLPAAPDLGCLLVRTDYADDEAFAAARAAAVAVYDEDGLGALLETVESPDLDGLTADDVAALDHDEDLFELAIADARTMADHTLLFVDLHPLEQGDPVTFRCVPEEVSSVVADLSISTMDFREFAENVDPDGVHRGF